MIAIDAYSSSQYSRSWMTYSTAYLSALRLNMDPGQAQVDLDPTWNLTCRFRSKQIQIKQIQVIADLGQRFHLTFRSQVRTFKQYITCFYEFDQIIPGTYCWSTDQSVIWPVGSGQNRSRSQWIMTRADPDQAFFGCLTCRYRSRSPADQSVFSLSRWARCIHS